MMDDSTTAEIETGETTIFARSQGSGPPILLLHGFPQTHLMWRSVAPLLARLRRSSRLRAQRLALGTWYVDESGPIALWQAWSDDVQGRPLDAGHFFAEEAPEQTAEALSRFFGVV